MADSQAFTSTPDSTNGNPIDVTTVTNGVAQTVDRQCMSIGDAVSNTRVVVGASGMQVQTGPIVITSGPVTALQGTSPWVIGGPVTLAAGTATVGSVALVTGAAVIGALVANQSVTGAVTITSGPVTALQGTSPWVISGPVTLATGAAVIGALTTPQGVSGTVVIGSGPVTALQGTSPWVDNLTQIGGIAVTAVTIGVQGVQAMPTQPLRDSGRSYRTFTFTSVGAVTTEALATLNINSAGSVTTGTTYTVTAGKRLRIQTINIGGRLTTVTNAVVSRITVRVAATVTVASAALVVVGTGAPEITAATIPFAPEFMHFPDGIEIPAGQQIGVSHLETATTAIVDFSMVGYEY